MAIFLLTCDWFIPVIGEYLDIYELTRYSMTCMYIYQHPILYSTFLHYETTIIDHFTFLLRRYQELVNDLRHLVHDDDDDENGIERISIEEQLDHSWLMLIQFVRNIRHLPSYQKMKGNELLKWNISEEQQSLDMSTFQKKCCECFLVFTPDQITI